MPQTEGKVQQVVVLPLAGSNSQACVWIGPALDDSEVFVVIRRSTDSGHRGAFKNSIVDALVTARANGKNVIVNHGASDAEILSMTFG